MEAQGRILDISKSGLRLRSAYIFTKGTRVQVKWGKTVISAIVRYSRSVSADEYDTGLMIEDAVAGPVHI